MADATRQRAARERAQENADALLAKQVEASRAANALGGSKNKVVLKTSTAGKGKYYFILMAYECLVATLSPGQRWHRCGLTESNLQ
jgi:hypothetical protein